MARAEDTEVIDKFESFYRDYYRNEIGQLAQKYPNEKRSLYVDWDDLYRFDPDLADDFIAQPDQMRDYAEEALRLYDLPVDVKLGQAHVRVENLQRTTGIRDIRARHRGNLVEVMGIVRKATDVRPKVTEAAFECQRCGTLSRIPQTSGEFHEPHECQGCERQGPFDINFDQSEFVDAQKLRVQESPEGLRGGETPQSIDVHIDDDITGHVTAGDHVRVTGVLHLDQQGSNQEKSPVFDVYMDGMTVEIEDEQFEDMDITDEDKKRIIELSNESDIYEKMIASMAPSIYGYEEEKLAIIMQLFSGVTKHLPDGSRTRGDLHMLLIGDPGTGKSQLLQYIRNLAPRSVYTSGKGSSSAGLTAAAVRDDFGDGQQWTLEAGALVLADQGIAAVDELDKMRCVTGDALVQLADGRIERIQELAREAKRDGTTEELHNGCTIRDIDLATWTMADDGRLVKRPVTAIHEYDAPDELTKITLQSGESLTATHDHPCFVFEDGKRLKRPASDLEPGDWTYVPETFPEPSTDGGTVSVDEAPTEPNPSANDSFGAVLGYLSGDGNIYYNREEGSYGIRFTNKEEELLEDFEQVCRDVFNADPVRHPSEQRADGVGTVRLHGREYADEVLDAGMNLETYDGKSFPTHVSDGGRQMKTAFVRAMADSEGNVDTASGNLRISSASEELLVGVKNVLLHFGIDSQIRTRERSEKRNLHVLSITAAGSLQKYNRHIGFTLTRKQDALEQVCGSVGGDRTILNVLPDCGELLKELREALRLHQSECGLNDATYCNFETGEANCSLHRAETVLETFGSRIEQAKEDKKRIEDCDWKGLKTVKERYHISQAELADQTSFSQQQISTKWGEDTELRTAVRSKIKRILDEVAATDISRLSELVRGDVKWRQISAVETVASERSDDRIPILQQKLADILTCPVSEAEENARDLLRGESKMASWKETREELERHCISLRTLAGELGVAGSTVSRWFNGVVDTDRFDSVRAVATEQCANRRTRLREILDEIESRREKKVYDLTVEGTHNFVANGMVVHNSEDRSAMHEALEQQSYHPDTEILLADGRRVAVGEFVDGRMESDPDAVTDGVDCEILSIEDTRIHSTDLDSNETTKLPVDRVSRHEAPEEFVRVSFSNGRQVTVTPEHPMFTEQGGDIGTVEARDLDEGAFVPAPRKLPNSSAAVELDDEPHVGREKDVRLPTELSEDLAEILGFLVAEGHPHAGSSHEIGFSNQDERLLARMDGLMSSTFGMESTDTTNEAGTVTKRWGSTKLYRWFETNFPGVMRTARGKRIPDRVLGASEEAIRRFLVGAFAGDGGVESEATSFSTASDGLAEDYADALSKIGVASRLHHDAAEDSWKVYVMGDSTERFVDSVVDPADERHADATGDTTDVSATSEESGGLRYHHVTDVETISNDGEDACEWVYDVTIEPTNTFVSKGVVLHNSVSISKAGINATLKSRCSLLGAANPKYGRFDQYEPIGEQIDLEPALISRFDLIFTVTDQPDAEKDANLAEHIIDTNYAGELHTHRENTTTSNVSAEEVDNVTEKVEPEIDAELLRKYIAYAKRNCYPMMSEEAKDAIREFYVDLRAKGQDEDAPVPVTARKLEALVRLSEASARMRLSDTVDESDAKRVIDIVRSCLQDIGVDPETGEFDADVVETGQSKTQRDRIKNIKSLISEIESEYDEGAPIETILDRAEEVGMERSQAEHEIEKLRRQGDVYEPTTDHLRTV